MLVALVFVAPANPLTPDRKSANANLKRFEGSGSKTIPFSNPKRGPVSLLMVARGEVGHFSVTLKGPGQNRLLVNTIGNYSGLTLVPRLAVGSYLLVVTASDGLLWGGGLERLQTPSPTRPLAGSYTKTGDWVYQVHTSRESRPAVSGACSCSFNYAGRQIKMAFKVSLVDYEGNEVVVFNPLWGQFAGQTVVNQKIPPGDYLVAVEGAGRWSLSIGR